MATPITPIDQTISAIPALRHRSTVNPTSQADKDDFVVKYEANNDHLANNTVSELNTLKGQVNTTIGQINTAVDTIIDAEALISPHYEAIDAVNANEANINAVNANKTNIDLVASNETNINLVASNEANINDVAINMTKITNLDTNMSDINNLDSNMSDINNLAINMSDINLVVGAIQDGTLPTIIDDTTSSTLMTYSSSKIDSQINTAVGSIDLSSKQDTLVSGTNIKTVNSSSILGSGNLDLLDATNPSITGSITEQVYNLTGTAINPANGTMQYKTVSANTTFTDSILAGQSMILRLINANSYTITFPTIIWVGAVAPILTANCVIVLWKEQTTLYGAFVGSLV